MPTLCCTVFRVMNDGKATPGSGLQIHSHSTCAHLRRTATAPEVKGAVPTNAREPRWNRSKWHNTRVPTRATSFFSTMLSSPSIVRASAMLAARAAGHRDAYT